MSNRTYTVLFTTNLVLEGLQSFQDGITMDQGKERTVTDTNTVDPGKVYTIEITNL